MTKDYDFVSSMTTFILEHIPYASKEWAEANAYTILSTAVGPEKYVRSPYKPLRLNTMALMIGPSGLAMKSVVMWGFTYPILVKLGEILELDLIVPNRYSIEGMIEYLSTVSSYGAFVRDEFTAVFKETSKSYLGDSLEFLSEIYDGTMQKRYTRRTKLEQTLNVYVPIISATTPYLYKIMKPSFFVQGTGNRPRYPIYELQDNEPDFTPDFSLDMDLKKTRRFDYFAERLALFYKCPVKAIQLTPESVDVWADFNKRIREEGKKRYRKDPFDLTYTYILRSPERVLKYSALRRLSSHLTTIEKYNQPALPVMKEDILYAIEEEKKSIENFHKMLRQWKMWGRKEQATFSKRDQIWQLCSVLASAPNRMFTAQQWETTQDLVNVNAFYELKKKALVKGWIREVDRKEVTDKSERMRLEFKYPATKVFTITKEWLKIA